MQHEFKIKTIQATKKFAARFAAALIPGSVIYLAGELGVGKTTLVRSMLRSLGHLGVVKSPTFTLLELYYLNNIDFYHFDLYRLIDPEELEFIGIRDYFTAKSICLIEWPNLGDNHLPPADLLCELDFTPSGRMILCKACSAKGELMLQKIVKGNEKN